MRMPQSASGPAASGAPAAEATAEAAAKDGADAPGQTPPADSQNGAASQNGTASQNGKASQNGAASHNSAATMNGTASHNGSSDEHSSSDEHRSPDEHSTASQNGSAGLGTAASHNGIAALAPSTTKPASAGPSTTASHSAKITQAPDLKAKTYTALALAAAALRRHWIASVLVAGGLIFRILTEIAYQPALIYIDTLKYLYDAWPGSDPVAYKIPLKMILAIGGGLPMVEIVQHLLGLGMAVLIYMILVRRGVPRWLGAIAIAPVLFDAYQLQAEAMIMPDVWFEAAVVLGLAVLLWRPRPSVQMLVIGAALLGASTGVRQIGEITIVPAVFLAIALGGGWRKMLINTAAVVCAFVFAIGLYLGASLELAHHARLSGSSQSLTYGRMSSVVNCATINLLPPERQLCPTKAEQALGPDWLDHSLRGPLRTLTTKLTPDLLPFRSKIVSNFNHAVEEQQPLRVLGGIGGDSIKLFAIDRGTSPGDTPISRWQFQHRYPQFGNYVFIKGGQLWITLPQEKPQLLATSYGNVPSVSLPIAKFLRSYQTHGGYTPGPLLLLSVFAGLFGSVMLFFRRRLTPTTRLMGLGCLGFFTMAVGVIGMSDTFEFTWRYQLPAIVTLPPAGAFGIAMLLLIVRRRKQQSAPAQTVSERTPELAAPAS